MRSPVRGYFVRQGSGTLHFPFVGHILLSSGRTAFWSKKLFVGGGILHLCVRKRNNPSPEKPTKPSKDPNRERPLNPDPKKDIKKSKTLRTEKE
jgi:hypothetical protein